MKPRICFSMIVFNGDHVLEASLESIYEAASQIVITEGPVQHYVDQGFMTSTDNTVEIIKSFPDPENKIVLIQGQWPEKAEMVRAQTHFVLSDIEYMWVVDADEVYREEDLQTVLGMLPEYDAVAFRAYSFLGLDHFVGGWDHAAQRHRIMRRGRWIGRKVAKMVNPETGGRWDRHRFLNSDELATMGIYLYHYTYSWPTLVKAKTQYYLARERPGLINPDFYERVWLAWMLGNDTERLVIEIKFGGIHEWHLEHREGCPSQPFTGCHPPAIEKRMGQLRARLTQELEDA